VPQKPHELEECDMKANHLYHTRAVNGLQRALWWVFALSVAYAVATDPEHLFAIPR